MRGALLYSTGDTRGEGVGLRGCQAWGQRAFPLQGPLQLGDQFPASLRGPSWRPCSPPRRWEHG